MATLKIPVGPNDHVKGDPSAAVVLVEYGDYQCPHCGHAHPIVQRVQKHFGKRLAFVFRNFPLNEIHPLAESAAEAAEFAGAHGKFWQMHDAIFENQDELSGEMLVGLARSLGVPVEVDGGLVGLVGGAGEGGVYAAGERGFFGWSAEWGVNGTPTFFINGERHDGGFEFEELVAAIEGRMG